MPDVKAQQVQAVQLPDNNPEGQMAKADLYRAAKMAIKLFQMIQDGQDLEEWVQAKLTKSADYLDSIYHYMEYQMKFGSGAVGVASVDDITAELDTLTPPEEERSEEDDEEITKMDESMNYTEKLQALLESAMKKKKTVEGFDADDKVGAKKKTQHGVMTKTATGVKHERSYGKQADDEEDDDKPKAKKTKKVKEAAEEKRAPAKKTEREVTLPSGAKTKVTKVQGWQSQKADKAASKERKDSYKAEAKKAKPDFLDMDKDGNKTEPMKKAVADKKKTAVKESADLDAILKLAGRRPL